VHAPARGPAVPRSSNSQDKSCYAYGHGASRGARPVAVGVGAGGIQLLLHVRYSEGKSKTITRLADTSRRGTATALWGGAGGPGGTVRRAAVCGNGAPALLVSVSTDFPI